MALQNAFANLMLDATAASLKVVDPDGSQRISSEATSLLLDSFDGTLATNWNAYGTNSGTVPSAAASILTFGPTATTASQGSFIRSNATFNLRASAYLKARFHVQLDFGAPTNNTRFWGIGTIQSAPTATSPILNGVAFELGYNDGLLYAVYYSNGTRTVVPAIIGGGALARPTDGAYHKYEVWYRQSRIDFTLDDSLVATRSLPLLASFQNPYLIGGSVNHTTAPSSVPIYKWSGASIADTGRNNLTISDGQFPWLLQTVKSANSATSVYGTDNAALTLAMPLSGQVVTGYSATSATAVSATVPNPGAGLRNYITSITFERFALAALTASAVPLVSTATNHAFAMTLPADAAAQGVKTEYTRTFPGAGIASTAVNSTTVFTAPAVTNVSWRVTVTYYVAP